MRTHDETKKGKSRVAQKSSLWPPPRTGCSPNWLIPGMEDIYYSRLMSGLRSVIGVVVVVVVVVSANVRRTNVAVSRSRIHQHQALPPPAVEKKMRTCEYSMNTEKVSAE